MMDAGSTGTRVYVYTWPRRTSEAVPKLVEVGKMSTKPGLSSFPANPNGSRTLGTEHQPCLPIFLLLPARVAPRATPARTRTPGSPDAAAGSSPL